MPRNAQFFEIAVNFEIFIAVNSKTMMLKFLLSMILVVIAVVRTKKCPNSQPAGTQLLQISRLALPAGPFSMAALGVKREDPGKEKRTTPTCKVLDCRFLRF